MSLFHALLSEGGLHVVSVEATDPISVSYNTPFFQVVFDLPITRQVTLSDESVVTMDVTWVEGSYDETTADDYVISGTLTLPSGVKNPLLVAASVTVTVDAALTPDLLPNQVLWAREENDNTSGNVDNWYNKFNRSNDLIKISDARRPNVNASGIDSQTSIEFTRANADTLQGEATLGLTGDFTYHVVFKVTDPTIAGSQFLIQNTDNGSAFVNTGFQALFNTSEMWVDFRKNDGGNQQRMEFPFTSTAWHLLTVKHNSNGAGASTNIVKIDGASVKNFSDRDAVVHNSNPLKVGGQSFNTNNPFGGSIAEIIITSDYQDEVTEASVIDYFKTRYPTEFADVFYFDETQFKPLDTLTEAWNGLDSLLRGDNKYDFIGGTLTGKIYYFEQGATIADWTATLLVDTTVEIQFVKIYGRDSSGRLVLISSHKDSVTTNDNVGKIMLHRADTTDDNGAYTSVDLITGREYPQSILVRDLDDDGVDEFMFTFQGTSSGEGGINWFDCSDLSDVLNVSVWTEHVAFQHESAWWLAGFYDIGGTERLVYSARTNRNSASVPGIYYLTPASPVTDTWTRTTIDSTNIDWLHVDVGNIFGNTNDIVAQTHDDDNVYAYNAASAYAKSTIVTGTSSGVGTNLRIINNTVINGRDAFMTLVEDDYGYLNYFNGSTWSRRRLFQTFGHPADSQIMSLDVDDSGFMTVVFDDNTDLANSHIYRLRL